MGQKEKLIERLKSKPRDFTFSEEHPPILMHQSHSRKDLLEYQVKQLIEILEQEGLL